jgi:hypothetical protein
MGVLTIPILALPSGYFSLAFGFSSAKKSTLRLGFGQTSNASRLVKRGCDPFVYGRDRFVKYTHGLGGPCYGW